MAKFDDSSHANTLTDKRMEIEANTVAVVQNSEEEQQPNIVPYETQDEKTHSHVPPLNIWSAPARGVCVYLPRLRRPHWEERARETNDEVVSHEYSTARADNFVLTASAKTFPFYYNSCARRSSAAHSLAVSVSVLGLFTRRVIWHRCHHRCH